MCVLSIDVCMDVGMDTGMDGRGYIYIYIICIDIFVKGMIFDMCVLLQTSAPRRILRRARANGIGNRAVPKSPTPSQRVQRSVARVAPQNVQQHE